MHVYILFAGDRASGDSSDEEENRIGHATISGGGQSRERDAGAAVSANLREHISIQFIKRVSHRDEYSAKTRNSLFSDVSAHRIHVGGMGLLYAVDRERRRHLQEQKKPCSF